MGQEIERRFLVTRDVRDLCRDGTAIEQGYLPSTGDDCTVRIRRFNGYAVLTMKDRRRGGVRNEMEWSISPTLADAVLRHSCQGRLIRKTRYRVPHEGFCWEVDVFEGTHAGLVIAEVELNAPDQPVPLPDWVGPEVTDDPSFSNSSLARRCSLDG